MARHWSAASILGDADSDEQEAVLEIDEKAILQATKEIRARQAEKRAAHQDSMTVKSQIRPNKERLKATRFIHGDCRHELKKLTKLDRLKKMLKSCWRL